MRPLLQAALLGTGQAAPERIEGALLEVPEQADPAWTLLLQAGVQATWERAGQLPSALPPPSAPSAEDSRAGCPEGVRPLLARLLSGRNAELLPEALETESRQQVAGWFMGGFLAMTLLQVAF